MIDEFFLCSPIVLFVFLNCFWELPFLQMYASIAIHTQLYLSSWWQKRHQQLFWCSALILLQGIWLHKCSMQGTICASSTNWQVSWKNGPFPTHLQSSTAVVMDFVLLWVELVSSCSWSDINMLLWLWLLLLLLLFCSITSRIFYKSTQQLADHSFASALSYVSPEWWLAVTWFVFISFLLFSPCHLALSSYKGWFR